MSNFRSASLAVVALVAISFVEGFSPTVPQCSYSVEWIHLQDYSDSFADDLPMLQASLPGILAGVVATYPESRYGVGTFIDKPLDPFGFPSEGPWDIGDYCIDVSQILGTADPTSVVAALTANPVGGGRDEPENQLGALFDVAKNPGLAGWSTDAFDGNGHPIRRVISLSTDASFHSAGDGVPEGLVVNDGDGDTMCMTEDYPSVEQTANALAARGIYTMFLIGEGTRSVAYDALKSSFANYGALSEVYGLAPDSSDLVECLEKAFEELGDFQCQIPTIDLVMSHDVTASYHNDLANLNGRMEDLANKMAIDYITPRFGLTTFGDKPLWPLGHAASGDYCYRLEQPLTEVIPTFVAAADGVKLTSGIDWHESQLDAIISSVLDPNLGWRSGSKWNGYDLYRVVVIATDSGFHRAPHAAEKGHDLAGHSGGMVNCLGEEYPSWEQAASALVMNDVHPLFVPTSDVAFLYRNLLKDMEDNYGIVGWVEELDDFGDMTEVVPAAVKKLTQKIRLLGAQRDQQVLA